MINICPNCKKVIGNNEKICPKCGTNILGFLESIENDNPQQGKIPDATNPSLKNIKDRQENEPQEITVPWGLIELESSTGIIKLQPITRSEAEKHPDDAVKINDANNIPRYYHKIIVIPPEKQSLYLMMKISKDLHFISILYKIILVISIIASIIGLLIWVGSCT